MLRPVIAIVGRPNVGKSTLFNRLVGRRQALVRDVPGVTRDRLYGRVSFGGWEATLVDTGGFDPSTDQDLVEAVGRHVRAAIEESDLVLFVVDCRAGVTPLQEEIARILRKSQRPIFVAANKADGPGQEALLGDVYRLGFPRVFGVSAEHGRGAAELLEALRQAAPGPGPEPEGEGLRVAVVGRPNVGKSSLVNALLGSDRVLVHEAPGTTRDAVDTPFSFRGRAYVLIDTAGIRRKGKVTTPLEKLAVVMALRSLERCQVAIVLLDASEGVTAQDCHIAGYAHEAGRAIIIAVNKWDLVPRGMVGRAEVVAQIHDRLPFLEYAPVAFTSAVTRLRLEELFDLVDQVAEETGKRIPPALVTKTLGQAMERRPMSIRGVPLTFHSAAQVGIAPPAFALRVNQPDKIHFSYERYLISSLRQAFGFTGSPVRLLFRRAPTRGRRRAAARRRR
ncbi:MAG: ribosome biogenesis GTPase Der [Candidatus Rokubacteria bacterium]|nr:ribosome biogenesis GTPase Der [Candidatus Rokubacteria bacterium]